MVKCVTDSVMFLHLIFLKVSGSKVSDLPCLLILSSPGDFKSDTKSKLNDGN